MVLDEEPIADLPSIAINGQRSTFKGVEDHQGNQLFGEVVWAIIVRAIRGDRRQPVGVVECPDSMITGRLGSGVGGIGFEATLLVPRGVIGPEGSVHLVGRHVEEPECAPPWFGKPRPVPLCAVQQAQGPNNVGLEKRLG